MSNVRRNYVYNLFYHFLLLFLPFATAPYISRIMGAEGLGIFSYNYSIIQYFMLFSLLGINNYGNRLVSKCKDNSEELSKNFYSLYFLQLFNSIFMLLIYFLYIFVLSKDNMNIKIVMSLYLFSTCFDINWFFFGLENFKMTITKNIIIKIISIMSIFIFVKNKNDLIIYSLIMSITALISQLCLWPYVVKKIKYVRPTLITIKKHVKPCAVLFIPVIAVSIYKLMDKVMLGILSNMVEVGLYESAEKIINVPLAIITSLGTVMLPRISNLAKNRENKKIIKYNEESMKFILFLAIPITFGLVAIADNFSILFYGNGFEKAGKIIKYLSITIPFLAWANIIRTQILLPNEYDSKYIKTILLGAFLNLIANCALIPYYKSIGAAIGTIIAELSVMLYQTVLVKKSINIKLYLKYFSEYFIKALIMFIFVISLNKLEFNKIVLIILQVFFGVSIYIALNLKYIKVNLKKFLKI